MYRITHYWFFVLSYFRLSVRVFKFNRSPIACCLSVISSGPLSRHQRNRHLSTLILRIEFEDEIWYGRGFSDRLLAPFHFIITHKSVFFHPSTRYPLFSGRVGTSERWTVRVSSPELTIKPVKCTCGNSIGTYTLTTMSQTQVHTTVLETGLEPRSSIPIRARSPHPSDSPTNNDKGQIELAELGRTASRGSKSLADVAGVSATPSTLTVSEKVAKAKKWKAHWQFVTLCWTLFLAGWNDGTIGPLLPRIQEVYHVSIHRLSFQPHLLKRLSFLGRICCGFSNLRL